MPRGRGPDLLGTYAEIKLDAYTPAHYFSKAIRLRIGGEKSFCGVRGGD